MSELHPTETLRGRRGDGAPLSDDVLSDRLDFDFYHRVLQRGWKVLLVGALIGAAIGFMVGTFRPVLYEGVTILMATPAPGAPAADVNVTSLTPLFRDARLASEVVEELGLRGAPHNLTPQGFASDRVVVEGAGEANLVKVGVRLADPKVAAEASRRLAEKAAALNARMSERRTSFARDALEKQLQRATERLDAAERELLAFQRQAQVDLLKEDANALLAERGELLELAIGIESERARLEAAEGELKKIPRVLDHPRDMSVENALPRSDAEREALPLRAEDGAESRRTARAGRGAPPARTDQAPISTLGDSQSGDRTARFLNPVYQKLEYEIATSRVRLAALERQRREVAQLRKADGDGAAKLSLYYQARLQNERLQADYDVAAKVRTDLLQRYQLATAAISGSPQLHVVNEAIAAERPLSRRIVEASGIGLAAGLLAAGLLLVVRANGRRA